MSINVTEKTSHHPLNPIGYIKNRPFLTSALLFGGLSIAVYLAFTYRYFPGIHYYPQKLQSVLSTPQQMLARCISCKPTPHDQYDALKIFKCYTNQTSWPSSDTFYCDKVIKEIFRKIAGQIHPDKCKLPEDRELFHKAMQMLGEAKNVIQKSVCSPEAKIARCIETSSLDKVLQCAGEKIPQTCSYLKDFALAFIEKMKAAFPERQRILEYKIQLAYQQTSCYHIPKSLTDWWG